MPLTKYKRPMLRGFVRKCTPDAGLGRRGSDSGTRGRHWSEALISGSIVYSIVDGNGLGGCECRQILSYSQQKQVEELVSLYYRRRVGDSRDRGDDRAEQALDNKGGPQKSPKQSIDSNSY